MLRYRHWRRSPQEPCTAVLTQPPRTQAAPHQLWPHALAWRALLLVMVGRHSTSRSTPSKAFRVATVASSVSARQHTNQNINILWGCGNGVPSRRTPHSGVSFKRLRLKVNSEKSRKCYLERALLDCFNPTLNQMKGEERGATQQCRSKHVQVGGPVCIFTHSICRSVGAYLRSNHQHKTYVSAYTAKIDSI